MHKMLLVAMLLMLPLAHIGADEGSDLLVYRLTNYGKSSLMLYDPLSGAKTPLLADINFGGYIGYSLSADGRLAYALVEDDQSDIFIQDIHAPDQVPVNITQSPDVSEYPSSWSIDGRYLASLVLRRVDNARQLHVWDGNTFVDITPQNMTDIPESYDPVWSSDGRLAFTVWYGLMDTDTPSEIYLWDGNTTTSLSQNPTGEDRGPVWSNNGQVAFLSAYTAGYDIFVWDGVSFKDGVPNRDTYINIAPELTAYYSFPSWTPRGQVAFNSQTAQDTHTQIYVWDGATATNISQNPNLHNGSPAWSHDGKMAFVTFFSQAQLLYVRDEQGRNLLTMEGQYTPAWSSNGYLIFCQYGWKLLIWNGREISEIAQSGEISAEWQSGSNVFCSSG